jgi:hypothetical protein
VLLWPDCWGMAQQAGSTGGGAPLIESIHGARIHGHKTQTQAHTKYSVGYLHVVRVGVRVRVHAHGAGWRRANGLGACRLAMGMVSSGTR